MKKRMRILVAVFVTTATFLAPSSAIAGVTITKVYDGDTITLNTGERVRFLQIDTPELSPLECYGNEARIALVQLLQRPGQLTLRVDPNLDQVDMYGRLLRYVFVGKTNINLKLVKLGAAAPYFYKSERGVYSKKILKAAKNAQKKSRGLWGSCPGTQLTPDSAITTVTSFIVSRNSSKADIGAECDQNYSGCIPLYSSDLNCSDIKELGLAPVKIIGKDVHRLDRNGNNVGCES